MPPNWWKRCSELASSSTEDSAPEPVQNPPADFPLQTLVMNLTNQCNLSCTYCYEFGEDKVATPEGKPKFMDLETAKTRSILLLAESAGRASGAHHLLRRRNADELSAAEERGGVCERTSRRAGPLHRFQPDHQRHAADARHHRVSFGEQIGVTVSMDGPPELHDKLRVFANGRGSYDIIEPRVRALIQGHRTRPITARVTLTNGVTDVVRIYRHLKHDLGFHEVGFAPVTTSPDRLYAINEKGMDGVLDQFHMLGGEWLEYALRGEMHGFSNVSDTIAELYQGVNKSHPCGAALGLMGVGPSGDIAPCHRFVDSDTHSLGNVSTGIDRQKQSDFLNRGHINGKVRLPHLLGASALRGRLPP